MTVTFPDELQANLESLATRLGFARVEDLVIAIVTAETEINVDDESYDPELEQLLVDRLESGKFFRMTPEWVAQFKKESADRRAAKRSRE